MSPTASVVVGSHVEWAFIFRDATNALENPSAASITIRKPDGTELTALTAADSEVTIGATIGADLASDLGLTAPENTAGTGIVQVVYLLDEVGTWDAAAALTQTTTSLVRVHRVSAVCKPEFD